VSALAVQPASFQTPSRDLELANAATSQSDIRDARFGPAEVY
jgi:hypothetical protein